MKVTIDEASNHEELEIIIKCKSLDEHVLQILNAIKQNDQSDKKLIGYENGVMCLIDPSDIYYFESVDKRNFIYTQEKVYDTPLKLYEIEMRFMQGDFFRASKASIINITKIKSLAHAFNGRMEVILENDEKLLVSRKYVENLKEKLGI